jgi:hypothetical protein
LKRLFFISLALACLAPVATTAATTLYAPDARIDIFAERAGEPHPKKLQMAFAVTEQFAGPNGQPLPIHFDIGYSHGWVGTDNPLALKGKVKLRVTVYRGAEVLWSGKRQRKVGADWPGQAKFVVCNAFEGPLEPGDLVVFDFKFRKMPNLDELDGADVWGRIGSQDTANWEIATWGYSEWDVSCGASSPALAPR